MTDPLFEVYRLNDDGLKKAASIAALFDKVLHELESVCRTDSREFSIVKTKLEEASFFAKKAMSIETGNQDLKVVR